MDTNEGATRNSARWGSQLLVAVLSVALLFSTLPDNVFAAQDASPLAQGQEPAQGQARALPTRHSPLSNCNNSLLRLRSIPIRWSLRFWRPLLFRNRSSRRIDGCRRTLI